MNLNADNEVCFSIRISSARGQRIMEGDRLAFATHWVYHESGNLLSVTDAENQTTDYTYIVAHFSGGGRNLSGMSSLADRRLGDGPNCLNHPTQLMLN